MAYYTLLLVAWRRRRALWRTYRRALAMMGVWALLYAAFAFYWVPGDMTFWMPVAAIWWLLLALVAGSTAETAEGIGSHAKAQRRQVFIALRLGGFARGLPAFILVLAVLLFAINGLGVVFPNHDPSRNWEYQVALSLAGRTATDDLVLTTSQDRLPIYVPYFAERQVISLLPLVEWKGEEGAFAALEQRIAEARAEGGRVFLVAAGPGGSLELSATVRFDVIPAWEVAGVQVLEVLP